jgi:hypothetical protein
MGLVMAVLEGHRQVAGPTDPMGSALAKIFSGFHRAAAFADEWPWAADTRWYVATPCPRRVRSTILSRSSSSRCR